MSEKKITLNWGQQKALKKISAFLRDGSSKVFILKGYAGTGKTTIIKSLIKYMDSIGTRYDLLASTGRAAKVLSDMTGCDAVTVHSEIYSFCGFNTDIDTVKKTDEAVQLWLNFGFRHDLNLTDVYVVDEASMISDMPEKNIVQSRFGSGRLLSDMIEYASSAKIIFVGDPCQLPPVGGDLSPALSAEYLKSHFGIDAVETTLTEIMRQDKYNGLVEASSDVRYLWEEAPYRALNYGPVNHWEKLPFRGVNNLELVKSPDDLIRGYLSDIGDGDYRNAVFICRSNSSCSHYTQLFRKLLGYEGDICKGELLLVVQNNLISGFRNGDLLVVKKVSPRKIRQAGLTFRQIEVEELYTKTTFKQLIIEDLLYQDQPNLNMTQQSELFKDFIFRMRKQNISAKNKEVFQEKMKDDIYLNALRATFGYALTCHKTQGGEWKNVYAYFPRNIMLNPVKYSYQWVYTAMTRAKERFYVVDDIYIEGYSRWN